MVLSSLPRHGLVDSVQQFGMTRSEAEHFVFYLHSIGGCIYLITYVDDVVFTGSDYHVISPNKTTTLSSFSDKRSQQTEVLLGD